MSPKGERSSLDKRRGCEFYGGCRVGTGEKPMLVRTEGIVIRGTDYGEGNKIVTLLTATHGKQGVVVRGARKPRSRFGAAAQLFTCGDYSFFKTTGLGTLNNAEVIEPFRELRQGLDGPAYAAYACELTDKAVGDEDAGAFVYSQLKACLTALAQGKDPQVVLRVYEMRIAAAAGYMPVLTECASCGSENPPYRFSPSIGGALCGQCRTRDPYALELDDAVWKLLRVFASLDMRRLGNTELRDGSKTQLQLAMRKWMDAHLGLHLKSRGFLDQLSRHAERLGNGGDSQPKSERRKEKDDFGPESSV